MTKPKKIPYEDLEVLAKKFRPYFVKKESKVVVQLLDEFIGLVAHFEQQNIRPEDRKKPYKNVMAEFFKSLKKSERKWVFRRFRDYRYESGRVRITVRTNTASELDRLLTESKGKFENKDELISELIANYERNLRLQ